MLRFREDPVGLIYGSLRDAEGHRALIRGLARGFASHFLSIQIDADDHRHITRGDYAADGSKLGEMTRIAAATPVQSPWFASPAAARLPEVGVLSDEASGITPRALARTDFHQFILKPFDITYSFVMYIGGNRNGATTIGISRSSRAGFYRSDELQVASLLLPHLRNVHAIQKNLIMQPGGNRAAWLLSASSQTCGRNLEASQTMEAPGAVLVEQAGQLRPVHPPDRRAFAALLAGVLSGRQTHGHLPLRDAQGTPRCVAHVHYCRREAFQTWLLTDPPAALVCLHPLDPDIDSLPPTLKHLYGLSPAECRVAIGMLESSSTRQVAESLARSEETVRSQLKAIYAKTGMHTQAQLLKLLYALSVG